MPRRNQPPPERRKQKPKPATRGNQLADFYFPLPATVIARMGETVYRHGYRTQYFNVA